MEMTEVLLAQQQVVRLQALLEASRQLHSTIELDHVLLITLEIVVRELELEGAFFTLFPQSYGEIPTGLRDASLCAADSDSAQPWNSRVLRFPLHDKAGNPFTELVVLSPPGRTLDLDETDFLESIAVQAAVAIENARFHQRALEWQRVESDLDAARQIQQSLVPHEMPAFEGYRLSARSKTCYEVGGDYLDIVSTGSGDTVIVVGDVAGKGLASALIGSSFRSAFRAMVHSGLSLFEIATRLNLLHFTEGEQARLRYVTAILVRLSPTDHVIEVLNAGHNPAFLVNGGSAAVKIKASGTPIGLLPFSRYTAARFEMAPGARLLLYTDGMTEVFRGDDEFGEDRLLETFERCTETTPEAALTAIWKRLDDFSGGQNQSDDMTALVLYRMD